MGRDAGRGLAPTQAGADEGDKGWDEIEIPQGWGESKRRRWHPPPPPRPSPDLTRFGCANIDPVQQAATRARLTPWGIAVVGVIAVCVGSIVICEAWDAASAPERTFCAGVGFDGPPARNPEGAIEAWLPTYAPGEGVPPDGWEKEDLDTFIAFTPPSDVPDNFVAVVHVHPSGTRWLVTGGCV